MDAPRTIRGHVLAIVVAVAATAAVAAAWLVLAGDAHDGAGTGSGFGTGRDVVLATAGSQLSGTISPPPGVQDRSIRWHLSQDGRVLERGAGAAWSIDAPARGSAELVSRAGSSEQRLLIRIIDRDDAIATDLSTTGHVLVDGGRPVRGEALAQGTRIDARGGSISFQARTRLEGGRSGLVRLEGARLTLRREQGEAGSSRVVVHLARDERSDEEMLIGDVEHLDGTRYVEVETPDAVAMVKGTRFLVHVEDEGTQICVDHGWVRVESRETTAAAVDVRDSSGAMMPRPAALRAAARAGDTPQIMVKPQPEFDEIVARHHRMMAAVAALRS